jgi:LysR family transcriptional regulator, mexEF-oprN operon transcriptional activator
MMGEQPLDEAIKLNLNLLVIFQLLMAERSVTRVADRIGRGQPAVSASLARLREMFQDPLLIRAGGTTLSPTPTAERLSERLAPLLDALAGAVRLPHEFEPRTCTRVFALSAQDDYLSAALIARFVKEAPLARLSIGGGHVSDMQEVLSNPRTDLAIHACFAPIPAHLGCKVLFRSQYRCVYDPAHRTAPSSIHEYTAARHVLASFRGDFAGLADEALARIGQERRVQIVTDRFSSLAEAVCGSDLITTLPEYMARKVVQERRLALCPVPFPMSPVSIALFWHRRMDCEPEHIWFRTLVADCFGAAYGEAWSPDPAPTEGA